MGEADTDHRHQFIGRQPGESARCVCGVTADQECPAGHTRSEHSRWVGGAHPHWHCRACKSQSAYKARGLKTYDSNRIRKARWYANARIRDRSAAFEAYGGQKCSCGACGETTFEFLTFDHTDNNGSTHRKEIGHKSDIAFWLRRNGYPAGFAVLCFNCNIGRHINGGICPKHNAGTPLAHISTGMLVSPVTASS